MNKKIFIWSASTIFLFFCLIFKANSQTQETTKPYTYTVGGNVFKGFIMKHDEIIGHLVQGHPTGFELFINKNTYGNKDWEHRFNYPDIGVSLTYFDLKNETIGKVISATSYLDFYLRRKRKSNVILKIGTGLAYNTNPYNRETNNKNNVISSRLSFALQGRIGYHFKLNDRLKLTSSLTLSHFSNGAFRLPNKGINIVSANFGTSYKLERTSPELSPENNQTTISSEIKYNINLSAGVKEVIPVGSKKYPFFTLSMYADKKINTQSALNLGMDFFYSLAVKQEVKTDRDLAGDDNPDFKQVGLVVGHELFVSKISLLTQLGIYVYKPYKSTGQPIYQRYGLKYYLNNKYYAGVLLKAHLGVADNVEWTFGIRF
ncbi:acyloxyacyl hydrolase [Fulvivirgaceae bacterium BMA10]|uniref:Acyloxyacyl hydrolase n=1 Tax=Splendidivirga corallicola TaxID=3051826 RepID=A0ABT8KQA3_9BACT|nr:acyloxyacyl hydrolase [Fulvivirgaceae bacterium BMA10]